MKIGIIGFGGLGKAFVRLLEESELKYKIIFILRKNGGIIDENGLDIYNIIKNEDDISKHSKWKNGLDFYNSINSKVDLLIEVSSTNIVNGEPAMSYIKTALSKGINVVTANKGPILFGYDSLRKLAKENKVFLGIGCTTGGALPSIDTGIIGCSGSKINEIEGILNGTSNYILKEMEVNNLSYKDALIKAQDLGIAEVNPNLDVEGYDTAIKILILANVLMGSKIKLKDIEIEGITQVTKEKINIAKSKGNKIKLIGRAKLIDDKVRVSVEIEEINNSHPLFMVDDKNKGVVYRTDNLGDITVIGGASSPRNSAASLMRDIINNIKIR